MQARPGGRRSQLLTVREAGRLIQSGSLPRRPARFLDLAPTTCKQGGWVVFSSQKAALSKCWGHADGEASAAQLAAAAL